MFAGVKRYFQELRRLGLLIREGRELLRALGLPSAQGSDRKIAAILMNIGVGHLRAAKKSRDVTLAAREMELRIMAGPRPSYEEAHLN